MIPTISSFVTLEENVLPGGFGEGVMDALARMGIEVPVFPMGVPDRFIGHGTVAEQLEECALSTLQISRRIIARFQALEARA